MELEEIKIAWEQMSAEISKQKKLTDSLIIRMTRLNYRNKTRKIILPETIGSIGCLVMAFFILLHFDGLHAWYLQVCGILTIFTLLLLPLLSFKSIHIIHSIRIQDNSYKEALLEYAQRKKKFVFFQKWNFYLGALLLVVILPVTGQLLGGKDVFRLNWVWLWYACSFIFFYFLANWIFKKYVSTLNEAQTILQELED